MNMLISSSSFIVREFVSNIFSKIYKDITLSIVKSIDEVKEIGMYDILFIHIPYKGYSDLHKAIDVKSNYNKIIILDSFKDFKILEICIESNLDGYVTDFEDEYEVKYILGKIINGDKFYDSNVVNTAMGNKKIKNEYMLTSKEEEVISEVIKGLADREIANKLDITELDVKKHVNNILMKFNLNSRKDIIIYFNNKQSGVM
ncbi:LuxR C-terminal-related transcriptional regulator [Terrisporobacter sp.]